MHVGSFQQPIVGSSSNSFVLDGYDEPGYPAATVTSEQLLCGNIEGWGPLSPYRWDFTPCFLDVLVAGVAVGGIVLGAGAIWYLLRREKESVKKDWHFWAKLVCHGRFAGSIRKLTGIIDRAGSPNR